MSAAREPGLKQRRIRRDSNKRHTDGNGEQAELPEIGVAGWRVRPAIGHDDGQEEEGQEGDGQMDVAHPCHRREPYQQMRVCVADEKRGLEEQQCDGPYRWSPAKQRQDHLGEHRLDQKQQKRGEKRRRGVQQEQRPPSTFADLWIAGASDLGGRNCLRLRCHVSPQIVPEFPATREHRFSRRGTLTGNVNAVRHFRPGVCVTDVRWSTGSRGRASFPYKGAMSDSDPLSSPAAPASQRGVTLSDVAAFMDLLEPGRLIGIDAGTKTLGLALSDVTRFIASALETIRRTKFKDDAKRLLELTATHQVRGFVLGLPANLDGSEGPRAQATRAFARNLNALTPLPILLWDERLTTVEAERVLLAADTSRKRRADVIDKLAATLILQGSLDRMRVVPR